MPNINSYADIITDWGDLIEAINRAPEVLAIVEPELQALLDSLAELHTRRARQLELTALRQEATQQIRLTVARGRKEAIQLRSLARGKIGPHSERLVHFDVAPIRPRKSKPAEEEPGPSEPEEPEVPEEPSDGGPVEAAKATPKPTPSDETVA